MNDVEITKSGTRLTTKTPYNPDFSPKAKKLGGKWDKAARVWTFDARDEERVRALCARLFGTDGSPVAAEDLLTVRARPDVCDVRRGSAAGELWICGRKVAGVTGRDSGARLGEGVVMIAGGFSSGGSVKNYRCMWPGGTVFEVRDVPRALAEKLHAEYLGITLLDAAGVVVAEPTSESAVEECDANAGIEIRQTAELHDVETEIAKAEGRLAGLRFRAAELRAA